MKGAPGRCLLEVWTGRVNGRSASEVGVNGRCEWEVPLGGVNWRCGRDV